MKKATNTENNPMPHWLMGGNPNAIEQQEAQGQRELVNSLQLPIRCNSPRGVNASEQYNKMGIKTLTGSKGDDLFLGVKLPTGWKKEATTHSMWNNLIDDKGRIRATFFYKAAFYDRDAFINFQTRYQTCTDFSEKDSYGYQVKDTATNEIVFNAGTLNRDSNSPNYFKKQDELQESCKEWLNENHPNWQDINAYWELN